MRARTQGRPPRTSVYFSCLSLTWLPGPGFTEATSLLVAARQGAEDSVIRGHLKETRTYLPQRAVVKMQALKSKDQGQVPTGSNPGHPLAEILGAKGKCGHLEKARSTSQSLSVNQKKAYPPGGRVTNILPGQTSSDGGAYVGNPGRTWHPFFPGRGYSESSPDGRSAPAGPAHLDTLAHPPGPKLHC